MNCACLPPFLKVNVYKILLVVSYPQVQPVAKHMNRDDLLSVGTRTEFHVLTEVKVTMKAPFFIFSLLVQHYHHMCLTADEDRY